MCAAPFSPRSLFSLGSILTPGQSAASVMALAAGTAYTLTGSNADVVYGTTSPTVVLSAPGTYLLSAVIGTQLSGATYAAAQQVSYNLRRQNNTAADITGSTIVSGLTTVAITTVTTQAGAVTIANILYSTIASTDIIGIRGFVSATPSAGSILCNSAVITAQWIHS